MRRGATKLTGVAVAGGILLCAGVLFSLSKEKGAIESGADEAGRRIAEKRSEARPDVEEQTAAEGDAGLLSLPPRESRRTSGDPVEFEDWAAESLRTLLGREVLKKDNQDSLLEFKRYLKEHYPDDWDTKLRSILEKAFPEVADQTLALFGKLDLYDEWLEENKLDLAAMQGEEIEEALWQKRWEVFGQGVRRHC